MARVNEGSNSFTYHPHAYPQLEWTIPAFTPQPQSTTELAWVAWWNTEVVCPPKTITHPTGFPLYFGSEIQGLFKDFQGPWSCIFKDQLSTEVYSMYSITAIFNIYLCDYGTVLVDKNKTWQLLANLGLGNITCMWVKNMHSSPIQTLLNEVAGC